MAIFTRSHPTISSRVSKVRNVLEVIIIIIIITTIIDDNNNNNKIDNNNNNNKWTNFLWEMGQTKPLIVKQRQQNGDWKLIFLYQGSDSESSLSYYSNIAKTKAFNLTVSDRKKTKQMVAINDIWDLSILVVA